MKMASDREQRTESEGNGWCVIDAGRVCSEVAVVAGAAERLGKSSVNLWHSLIR